MPHELLTSVLPAKGVGTRLTKWISDFLSERSFEVKINDTLSRKGFATTGCPQGTVMGSLLFSFFVDQVKHVLDGRVSFFIYADDIKLVKSIRCVEDCTVLQSVLDDFHVWSEKMGLQLSTHKLPSLVYLLAACFEWRDWGELNLQCSWAAVMDDRAAGWPKDSWIKPEQSQNEVGHLVDDDNFVNNHNALRSANPLGRIVAAILRPLHAPLTHDPTHRRIDAAIAAAADALTTSNDGLVEPTLGGQDVATTVNIYGNTLSLIEAKHAVIFSDHHVPHSRKPSMTPEEVRAQYYATYDPMTGVRIAATLGAIMSLFALFLIFKARCKSIRSRLNLANACPVIAKIRQTGEVVELKGLHNHLPDEAGFGIEFRHARTEWIKDIRGNPRKNPSEAIIEQRRKLPREAASRIVPVEHYRTCRHHAGKVRPPRPESLLKLYQELSTKSHPRFNVTEDGERLLSSYNPVHNTLLVTTRTLLRLLSEAKLIHADATYKIRPRELCKQIFTIHGNWGGHVGMVACALMNRADVEAYRWVLQQLKQAAPYLTVEAYMGDWDCAMRKAVRSEFSDIHLFGCHFHYSQSLLKKAKSLGLGGGILKPGAILSNFLAFTALPLLPPELINPTFEALAARAMDLHVGFPPFLEYVASHWLRTIGPHDLSVFGLQQRTNNDVEANNGKLLRRAGRNGPVWKLLATITEFAQDTAVNKMIHERGVEYILSRPSKPTKENKLRVNSSWELLASGNITAVEFIDRVKFKAGKRNHLLTLRKEGRTGDPIPKAWLKEQSEKNLDKGDYQPRGDDATQSGDSCCDLSEEDGFSEHDEEPCHDDHGSADFDFLRDHSYAKHPKRFGGANTVRYEQSHNRFPPITYEMRMIIKDVFEKPSKALGDVSISRIAVSSEDLRSLIGLNWLNDVVINVYLNLIVNRSRDDPRLPRVYSFNTFFLECYSKHGYADVSKWTRRDDIFAQDIVLVPVHRTNHWAMAIIDMRQKMIKYMDSQGNRNDDCLEMLRDYLADEISHKKKSELNFDQWRLSNEQDIPLQQNGSDCGVFALKYADYAARDAKIDFTQEDMPYYREMMIYEIAQSMIMPNAYDTVLSNKSFVGVASVGWGFYLKDSDELSWPKLSLQATGRAGVCLTMALAIGSHHQTLQKLEGKTHIFLNLNLQSLQAHALDISSDSLLMKATIFCFTATWCGNEHQHPMVNSRLQSRNKRPQRAGGVAIYDRMDSPGTSESLRQPISTHNDCGDLCFARLQINNHMTTIVCIYISPGSNFSKIEALFIENKRAFDSESDRVRKTPLIICGDLNWNMNKPNQRNQLISFMSTQFNVNLITDQSLSTTNSNTCLDLIFTRNVAHEDIINNIAYFSYYEPTRLSKAKVVVEVSGFQNYLKLMSWKAGKGKARFVYVLAVNLGQVKIPADANMDQFQKSVLKYMGNCGNCALCLQHMISLPDRVLVDEALNEMEQITAEAVEISGEE
ncbi:uncharacterized protein LOC100899261 [Galendromus occidentalis]|uniref:Uncharacterized protein LOC100899261 n=1 Tax=Galendromus occidentalis TaxID=34638 RepID=A0AAJ7L4F6_9ACAR|nr:uncharacterized protein LOC100899261 [Galendromus occidentalis]